LSEPEREGLRVLALASGGGTNLEAILDAEAAGKLGGATVVAVVADRPEAYALERGRKAGKPALLEVPRQELSPTERRLELSDRILKQAETYRADLIVLAGFLSILQGRILNAYAGRIINLHPSLLPQYGGPGMYGDRVHRAVLAAGERESGCTIHVVDSGTDTGPLLLQRRVPVLPGDTPESLAERIHREEHIAIVEGVVRMAGAAASAHPRKTDPAGTGHTREKP
jgi:phosphoribosylglycinamide formyltransferase-1